jgi:hypothetical protein
MLLQRVISILIMPLLGHFSFAQEGALTISPELGVQTPFSKKVYDGFSFGELQNNEVWVVASYGLKLSYHLNDKTILNFRFLNGQAGYSMGVVHKQACNNGYNGSYGDRWKSSSFNERRFTLTFEKKLKGYQDQNFYLNFSAEAGVGIDFRSHESDSARIIMPALNRCGEEYYLDDINYNRKKIGLIVPMQVNIISHFKRKERLRLSIFYHIGITEHFRTDVRYVTRSYIEKSTFSVRGTSMGLILSYPIVLIRGKKQ